MIRALLNNFAEYDELLYQTLSILSVKLVSKMPNKLSTIGITDRGRDFRESFSCLTISEKACIFIFKKKKKNDLQALMILTNNLTIWSTSFSFVQFEIKKFSFDLLFAERLQIRQCILPAHRKCRFRLPPLSFSPFLH